MSKALEGLEQAQRQELEDGLRQCTHANRVFFKRIFPDGVSAKKLESAIALVERTVIEQGHTKEEINEG